ncbi:FmdB family zinc ribbon protein [Actibacterium lipolyticum]|uniref:Zinc ribbon domain protein n=1 Tax=Actibacterium lipolyticum TaxID=1524263 RepID=A0A238JRI4_9RHOB|nr:zinc ribbon domain-containing protein [Actibacterium lipolyticum]SMX33261.1 Zinc ribbon domain protein [Actibacterium lipolyticum]
MPIYDYVCKDCGPFTDFAPMAQFAAPCNCPDCDALAPRAILSAPKLAIVGGGVRKAHETNERSADSPRKSTHGPGCSCCSAGGKKRSSGTLHRPDGSKSFPNKRPWMISH